MPQTDPAALTEAIHRRAACSAPLAARINFVFEHGDIVPLDGKVTGGEVSDAAADVDCTIRVTKGNLAKLLNGRLNGTTAFTMGEIKISGDMGIALKLQDFRDD